MGWLFKLITLPVTGPLDSLVWIAKKVAEQADRELYDAEKVHGQLMELELKLDLGEINEEEYLVTEEVLLERLRIIREHQAPENEG